MFYKLILLVSLLTFSKPLFCAEAKSKSERLVKRFTIEISNSDFEKIKKVKRAGALNTEYWPESVQQGDSTTKLNYFLTLSRTEDEIRNYFLNILTVKIINLEITD